MSDTSNAVGSTDPIQSSPLGDISESEGRVPLTEAEQLQLVETIRARFLRPITPETLNEDFHIGQGQGYAMAFAKHAGQLAQIVPNANISESNRELMHYVLNSERAELDKAMDSNDLLEIVDGICDEIYVLLWMAVGYGIYLPPFLKEVCVNNYLKTIVPPVRDEKGKLQKPPGHKPPRIKEMLELLLGLEVERPMDIETYPAESLVKHSMCPHANKSNKNLHHAVCLDCGRILDDNPSGLDTSKGVKPKVCLHARQTAQLPHIVCVDCGEIVG